MRVHSLRFFVAFILSTACYAAEPVSPLSPEQAIEAMRLDPALSIELVASEPMVQDPVAICWDAHGAMYVAEMGDYPALPTGGRIKRLVDTDGDGRMDRATIFSADIAYPTSVLPHRDGILVTAAPDIVWLKDTDGDGVADQRKVILTGFGEGNQQLRVNGLVRGLDNWVYGANGRSDGEIGFVGEDGKRAGTPVSIRSTDFRFQPDDKLVETAGGFTQFGQSFDDFGQRFISWNTVHIRHVVMEQRYLARNPNAPVTATTQELSDAGSTPRLFPVSQTTKRFNAETPGFFNASCGLTIFRGDALGEPYRGNAFACEPLSNVVHRDVLRPEGASYIASRAPAEQDREFLASTDSWFRPVNLATGPDGSLYVVDFYRRWVEHPQWVANEEARRTVDWSEGKEFGRIYRVLSKVVPQAIIAHPRDIASLTSVELLPLLGHSNAWQRETAQRLLVERQDVSLVEPLRKISMSGNDRARVQAMATLVGLKHLDVATLARVIASSSAEVRRVAILFSEQHLQKNEDLAMRVAGQWEGAGEESGLRFQISCSLGYAPTSKNVLFALANLFIRDGGDPWMRQALFTSVGGRVQEFIQQLVYFGVRPDQFNEEQIRWLVEVIRSEARGDQAEWLSRLPPQTPPDIQQFWRGIVALGFADAQQGQSAAVSLRKAITEKQLASNLRLVAIGLQRFAPAAEAIPVLRPLLAADQPLDLQQWAAESAFAIPAPEASRMLTESYRSMTPSVQRMVLDHLVSRKELAAHLAEAIESREIPAADLTGTQRDLLASRLEEPAKSRLAALWAPASNEPKNDLILRYAASLETPSEIAKGKQLFQQHCRTCHQRQGDGNRVGPDLTGVAGRSPTDILADVLDPNRSVSVDGRSYVLITKDGVVSSGIIAGETATSVTLKKPGGILESVLRSDIEELRFTGKSLMPDGFEQLLPPADLANLIAFLKDADTK